MGVEFCLTRGLPSWEWTPHGSRISLLYPRLPEVVETARHAGAASQVRFGKPVDPRTNFVGAMRDLESCAASWDQYHNLRVPGIVRLLLMDSSPLVDQVNREFRQKIRFHIGSAWDRARVEAGNIPVTDLIVATVSDSFDPESIAFRSDAGKQPREVTRDQLLGAIILIIEGTFVTVADFVRHLAYVHGLTHGGKPIDDTDKALLAMRRTIQVGETALGIREIRAIGAVVHRGLKPLYDAVIDKYSNDAT